MTDDELTKTQAQTGGAVLGTLLGAGAGALLGMNSSSSSTKILAIVGGAAAGGALGWYAGKCWGDSIVKAKEEYRNSEEYALANLQQIQQRIEDSTKTNNTLMIEIAKAEQAGKIEQERLAIIQQNVQTRKDIINNEIAIATEAMSGASEETGTKLREQIAQLEFQRQEITNNLTRLEQYT